MSYRAKTVLVIDDEADIRDYLSLALVDSGFIAHTARNGLEALTRIHGNPPDLISLDVKMPEKSGIGLYRILKQNERFKQIPIVFVTGVSDSFKEFISTRRRVPPPEGYLRKPVSHGEYLRTVRSLLAPKRGVYSPATAR